MNIIFCAILSTVGLIKFTGWIFSNYLFWHDCIYAMGRPPIIPSPNPAPAPLRAETPIEGMNTSRMLKVAAAVNAMITISSTCNCFFGSTKTTNPTTSPSMRYLIARFTSSVRSIVLIYNNQTKKSHETIETFSLNNVSCGNHLNNIRLCNYRICRPLKKRP